MRSAVRAILVAGPLASIAPMCGETIAKPDRPGPPIVELRTKEGAADDAWDRMPMAARRVLFATGPVKRFGAYEPRGDNVFRESEKVVSYIEPVGFVFRDVGDGVLMYGFKVARILRKADGTVLRETPDYAVLDSRTRSRRHDIEFASSLDIKGLSSGTYALEFTFNDLNSDKRMVVSQTFRVVR